MTHIRTEIRDRIARIELDRADKKNAITADMYQAMADVLRAAEADPQVRVILIHGKADCFTAGNDLKDFLERPPGGDGSPVFQFLRAISAAAKPVVAAVGGPAVGIGTTMLLHCDFVYASPTTRFQMPFVTLGLVPEAASSLLLPMVAGIAALPPASVRMTKALMKSRYAGAVAEAMGREGEQFRAQLGSAEAREAMQAFFEKRKPDFSKF